MSSLVKPAEPESARNPPRRPGPTITVLNFRALDGPNTLRGVADFHIPAFRMRLFGCLLHESHGKFWIALPGKPMIDKEGVALRDPETHKIRYTPLMGFDDVEVLHRFTAAALAALMDYGVTISSEPA